MDMLVHEPSGMFIVKPIKIHKIYLIENQDIYIKIIKRVILH